MNLLFIPHLISSSVDRSSALLANKSNLQREISQSTSERTGNTETYCFDEMEIDNEG